MLQNLGVTCEGEQDLKKVDIWTGTEAKDTYQIPSFLVKSIYLVQKIFKHEIVIIICSCHFYVLLREIKHEHFTM